MERIDVSSMEIRDYALSDGWRLIKEALRDGLFVLNSPYNDYSQLSFPKDENIPEFQEMAGIALNRLANLKQKPIYKIIEEIREVNDDVISIRYYSDKKDVSSISFEEALQSIEATRQLLLSAASSIVNPSLYHPKLIRVEPQELIKKTRFRHTEEGSFILKISCPFDTINSSSSLFEEDGFEKPLSRSAFELINSTSLKIIEAIEEDGIQKLYEDQEQMNAPDISFNFCDALSKLYDEDRELPFQLIFNWSKSSMQKLQPPSFNNKVAFPYSTKLKMEEVKGYFAPRKNNHSGIFYGTVETLDGVIGEDGKRFGQVMLSLLYENELIKTKVNLNADAYALAVEAHRLGGAYVQIKGDLKRGRRANSIENLQNFDLLSDIG